jgi:hypothetical protein
MNLALRRVQEARQVDNLRPLPVAVTTVYQLRCLLQYKINRSNHRHLAPRIHL